MEINARAIADAAGGNIAHGELRAGELARKHYENFNIAAFFLQKRLRQDLFNVYAFCRLADDIADERRNGDREAEETLDNWEKHLENSVRGNAPDPIFEALGGTINTHRLSLQPFRNLLHAFKLDLTRKRWETWDDLRYYTRHSADPVGRIVLEIFGCRDPDIFALSDKICTALQLTNHWQDIREDWERGRIYIPLEDMKKFGVSEAEIDSRAMTDRFRNLMKFEVERADRLFREGLPILRRVDARLRFQIALYWCGGMKALKTIRRVDYDVLNQTPKLNRLDKVFTVFNALGRWILSFR